MEDSRLEFYEKEKFMYAGFLNIENFIRKIQLFYSRTSLLRPPQGPDKIVVCAKFSHLWCLRNADTVKKRFLIENISMPTGKRNTFSNYNTKVYKIQE